MEKITLEIPFPDWDGIKKLAPLCDELRQETMFAAMPDFRTPRRITMSSQGAGEGFDDRKVVRYWIPGNGEASMWLGGRETAYGFEWEIISLHLVWKDYYLPLPEEMVNIHLRLDTAQVKTLQSARHSRINLREYERRSEGAAERANASISAGRCLVAELATPIRRAHERRLCADAAREAVLAGREFSWMPGYEPVPPPLPPPAPELPDDPDTFNMEFFFGGD